MTTSMPIELVVFDLAGTTVEDDDAVNHCLRAALGAAGFDPTRDAVNAVMGLPKPEAIRIAIGEGAEPGQIAAIHGDFVRRMIAFYASEPSVREVHGASEAFRSLRRSGVKIAVNTGFGRSIVDPLLDRLGWLAAGLVDASVCSDEVARGRPHPDMILALMDRLGVSDPKKVAKVGDTPADLLEGTAAGCARVIGVTNGTHTRDQLAGHPHTDLVASVADVPGLL